jgi:hypothetical protein
MSGAMGFKRKTCRAIGAAMLCLWAARTTAEPREPLTITRLADPGRLEPIGASATASPSDGSLAFNEFSRSIIEDLRAEQESIAAKCRSMPGASAPIVDRWSWEARCRYQRR